jgi:eukaryotic-like serine/threonine-protein kinase
MNLTNIGRSESDLTKGPSDPTDGEDPRLLAAVQEYMAASEAGKKPNRQEFLSRFPDIRDDLSACLQGLAFVNSAADQINGPQMPAGADVADSGLDADVTGAKPLGDFKLLREIGRGGMGVVYEAMQLSLGRRVAVKVLSFAAALDPRHLQRFRNEAQAAAQLHHTNIVPVYAVGCERSVHFYAMQLIEGQSLADVIRELRKTSGRVPAGRDASAKAPDMDASWHPSTPANATIPRIGNGRITTKDRLASLAQSHPADSLSTLRAEKRSTYFQAVARLGLQAAEALDYAHKMGVVHRDIKPANLLLDGRGNLWITDFGLAQFYADAGLTQTGDVLGTFRYMSPEQASGRAVVLDQRTDIYSLGVTLYELLTLERALPGTTREQLLHEIGSVEPRSPRSIDGTIPQELETVLFKSISKDPADRYPTAKAFAEDLGRFLHDEPILARPPSLWDKTVKWNRRHKSLALSIMMMLLIIAIGLLTSTLLIAREQGKTKDAYVKERDKAKEANEQRALAEKSFKQARDAVDFFTRVARDEMSDNPGLAEVRKELLEASLVYYQTFLDERMDDPSIGAELSVAQSRVNNILTELSTQDDGFRIQSRADLLLQPSVRQDLGLSPEQVDRINTFAPQLNKRKFFKELDDLKRSTSEEKRAKLTTMMNQTEDLVNSLLTPDQVLRLRQIAFQVGGPMAFNDHTVADALFLTRDQKDRIRIIQNQSHGKPPSPGEGGPRRQAPQDGQRNGETARRKAMASILALLNPTQMEVWREMIGKPFDGQINHGFGAGPPH